MNIAAMSMTIIDKRRAIQNRHYNRISERALLFTALFGGAPLMYLTMLSIRHKRKRKNFMITNNKELCYMIAELFVKIIVPVVL